MPTPVGFDSPSLELLRNRRIFTAGGGENFGRLPISSSSSFFLSSTSSSSLDELLDSVSSAALDVGTFIAEAGVCDSDNLPGTGLAASKLYRNREKRSSN